MIVLYIVLWVLLGLVSLLLAYCLLIIVSSFFVDMNKEYERDSQYYRWLLNSSTALMAKIARIHVKVTKIGVQDEFGYSGPAWELLDKFGLTQPHIAKVIREVVAEDK